MLLETDLYTFQRDSCKGIGENTNIKANPYGEVKNLPLDSKTIFSRFKLVSSVMVNGSLFVCIFPSFLILCLSWLLFLKLILDSEQAKRSVEQNSFVISYSTVIQDIFFKIFLKCKRIHLLIIGLLPTFYLDPQPQSYLLVSTSCLIPFDHMHSNK